jgi:hypothetical protein
VIVALQGLMAKTFLTLDKFVPHVIIVTWGTNVKSPALGPGEQGRMNWEMMMGIIEAFEMANEPKDNKCPCCGSGDIDFSEASCGTPMNPAYDCHRCGSTFFVSVKNMQHLDE